MKDVGVIAAISVLGAVFVIALIGLLIVVKKRYCKPTDLITRQYLDTAPDLDLIDGGDGFVDDPCGVELDEVGLNANLEQLLQNETWAHDAAGLVPHCLAILRTAHLLTQKLVSVTLANAAQLQIPETLTELVAVARRIGARVDDVVRAMYPPLDPRLLEARCSALHLSVSHLVLVAKSATSASRGLDWVDQSLADVEDHLKALREASVAYEVSLHRGGGGGSVSSLSGPPSATNDPWTGCTGGEMEGRGDDNQARQQAIQLASIRESSQVCEGFSQV